MDITRIITNIIPQLLAGGGPQIVMILLLVMITALFFERKRLLGQVEKKELDLATKDDRIIKILDDYKDGNKTLTEAFTQLRLLLAEIKGKL